MQVALLWVVLAAAAAAAIAWLLMTDPGARYAEARGRWQSLDAQEYSYRVRVECQACDPAREQTVRVVAGKPQSVPEQFHRYDTAEKLFTIVSQELRRAHQLRVRYDSKTGVPTLISADPDAMSVDEEYSVHVSDVRVPDN